ncbi:MAG TPA: Nramp family divalent metal transporter, partial [Halobacteriales archaeon]|nr:Nramp family divalent metal transporter [Halobacteriales archaeon]
LCRERFSLPVVLLLWVAAELAMIATDVAEIIGAAIGFSLVFSLPLAAGAVLAGASSFALLGVRSAYRRGFRWVEFTIMAMVGIVSLAFVFEMVLAQPSAASIGAGLVPSLPRTGALFIVIGILGATVMPHSVYLHPRIVQDRRGRLAEANGDSEATHRRHFHLESVDTVFALSGALFVNAAMLIVAAAALQGTGIESLEEAYVTLSGVFNAHASLAFGVALIAAGLSSSLVATMAGQTVMDGFLDLNVNVWIRRSVTLVPSLVIVALGFDPTGVLVASQVALSFELPFVLLPLLWFTREAGLMGSFVNGRRTTRVLALVIGVIVVLNGWLLYTTVFG